MKGLFVVLFFTLQSCQQSSNRQYIKIPVETQPQPQVLAPVNKPLVYKDDNSHTYEFNVTDKNIYTNGNRYVASTIFNQLNYEALLNYDTLFSMSTTNSITKITRSYSKYLGKVVTLSGEVKEISELERSYDINKDISGDSWYALLLWKIHAN